MSGDVHVRFRERLGVRFPRATRLSPLLPKGTVLHVISWHDNSEANRWNDDPRNWAGFGQRTSDDMSFSWVSWYELSDEDFETEVEARRAASGNNEND